MPMKNPPHPGRSIKNACLEPLGLSVTEGAKILGVSADLITPLLGDLAAEELAVRDEVPASGAADAGLLQAVYLPPFYQAERSLAQALLRLLAARADRLSAFAAVDWDKALGWLRGRTGAELAHRPGRVAHPGARCQPRGPRPLAAGARQHRCRRGPRAQR